MAFVNYSTREINVKVVYYGAGLCGKTANLQYLYSRAPTKARGRLISLATEAERTLFFDFLPMNLGTLRGFKVRFHLYTVPGQVFYEASRKLILKGVDGLLFVVDSDPLRLDANAESWAGLLRNLTGYGLSVPPLPAVIQYNKRDLPGALPVAELWSSLGSPDLPQFESVATDGTGVFESLKGLAKGVLNQLQHETLRTDRTGFAPEQPAVATPPSMEEPPAPPEPVPSPPRAPERPPESPVANRGDPGRPGNPVNRPMGPGSSWRSSDVPAGAGGTHRSAANPDPLATRGKTDGPPAPSMPSPLQPGPRPAPSPATRAGPGPIPVAREMPPVDTPRPAAAIESPAQPKTRSEPVSSQTKPPEPTKRRGFGWFRRSR